MRNVALWGLKERLDRLTGRERLLLAVAAIAVAGAGLVYGIWQPLLAQRQAQMIRLQRYERTLAAVAQMPQTAATQADPRPVAAILTQTAAAQNLTILRLDTPKDASATLTLQDAPFETLILWIDGLDRNNGLILTSATIRRTDAPGIVSADLSVQRANP